jgi:hypothetical protein
LGKKLLGNCYMIFHQTTLLGHAWKNTKFFSHLLENERENKIMEKHLATIKTPFKLGGNFQLTLKRK